MKITKIVAIVSILTSHCSTPGPTQSEPSAQLKSTSVAADKASTRTAPVVSVQQTGLLNANFDTPESVYVHTDGFIYVSNISGAPDQFDQKGWISKLDSKGNVIDAHFIDGLNAPKGMRGLGNKLWVSDINALVEINLKDKKITRRTLIKSAKFLNDVTVDPQSRTVYVSDTIGNAIFVMRGAQVGLFARGESLEHPNGLYFYKDRLYVGGWGQDMGDDFSTKVPGRLYYFDIRTKQKHLITKEPVGNLDGIEFYKDRIILSDWMNGKIMVVKAHKLANGTPTFTVSDLMPLEKGAADIGLNKETGDLYVPLMMSGKIRVQKML